MPALPRAFRGAAAAVLAAAVLTGSAAAQTDGPAELLAFVDPRLDPVVVPAPITAPPSLAHGLLPAQLTAAGRQVFFVADDRQHGPELWVSDGTAAGSRQVVDLLPGAEGSQPWILGAVGERVVFWARTAAQGVELHASDGTAAGTVLLADTCHGGCSGAELPELWFGVGDPGAGAAPFAGGLAVAVRDGGGCTLWATDGTPGGTALADPWGGSCGRVDGDGARVWYGDWTQTHLRLFDAQAGGRAVALPPCPSSFFWLREAAPHGGELVVLGRCFGVLGDAQAWRLRADQPAERISPRAAALSLLPHGDRLYLALAGAEGAPAPGGGHELVYLAGAGSGPSPFGRLPGAQTVELLAVAGEGVGKVVVQALLPQGHRLLAVAPGGSGELLSDEEIAGAPHGESLPVATMGGQFVFFSEVPGPAGQPPEERTRELWTTGGSPQSTRRVTSFTTPVPGLDGAAWRLQLFPELAVLPESLVLSADDGDGQQLWGLERGEASRWGCQPGPETLCLGGERFAVRVAWRDPRSGHTGAGRTQAAAGDPAAGSDSGYFWFFRPGNLELLVKVLDGTGVNGHHWVFHGPMTDLEYDLHVTDLATGATRSYHRAPGSLCGGADTAAFPVATQAAAGAATTGVPMPVRVEAIPAPLSPPPPPCDPATDLCLGVDGRFRVRVAFRDHRNGSGEPQAARRVAETEDSGSFWFFRPGNREVLVKVLDGTPVNGWFWIFVGSLTDLGFDVEVFDTWTQGAGTWSYHHPRGSLCGTADTAVPF